MTVREILRYLNDIYMLGLVEKILHSHRKVRVFGVEESGKINKCTWKLVCGKKS